MANRSVAAFFLSRARAWLLAIAAALVVASASEAAAQSTEAKVFAQENIDKGYGILNNASLSQADRRAQFRDFILELTDLRRVALFTLGEYKSAASPAEIEAYVDAFRDYAVAIYEVQLAKYSGQTLKVTGAEEKSADDVFVAVEVTNPQGGEPLAAALRVRKDETGKLIVMDIKVQGVWLVINQHDEIAGYLKQNGGSVPKLTSYIAEVTGRIRSTVAG